MPFRLKSVGVKEQRRLLEDGVNESQSKFLEGTYPMSQIRPNASLFQLGQYLVDMNELLALKTGLGSLESQRKHKMKQAKRRTNMRQSKQNDTASYYLISISSNILRATLRNHRESMTRVRKTRAIDQTAQEQYRLSSAIIFTNKSQEKSNP
jgi:hypothetical protein